MPDIKGILTKTELRELLGGRRRYLNPFHNPLAAIKAATKHNLVLRKKALWSIRKHGMGIVENRGLNITTLIISLTSIILALYLNNPVILIPFIISSLGSMFLDVFQKIRINNAIEHPLFLSDGLSTGCPELDIILSPGPFEAEAILAEGGLQAGEIKKLAGFIEIVRQENDSECQIVEGLIRAKATIDMSSQTWGLVRRATEIMSGKVVPRFLSSASPVITMFSVMEHAGIDIRTPKTDVPLKTL